jgi:hypothetical protein
MTTRKYGLPAYLRRGVDQKVYERWLHRKAVVHVRRDRKRGNRTATNESYKVAIHKAVVESDGTDPYKGERLNWKVVPHVVPL